MTTFCHFNPKTKYLSEAGTQPSVAISIYLCDYNYFNYLKNLSKFQKLHPYSIKYHHFEE